MQFAPSGKAYPLVVWSEVLALGAMEDDFFFAESTALTALVGEGITTAKQALHLLQGELYGPSGVVVIP